MPTVQVLVELVHAIGMFAEDAVIVTTELALKPVAATNTFADVFDGAYVVPEVPTAVFPNSIATCGVIVKVAVALLPLLSEIVTACGPATPACELAVPAGVVKTTTAVPLSVTVAGVNTAELAEALLPTVTELGNAIVAVGPKPVSVAVTFVPTGPEVGDKVIVAPPSDSVVVAMLPHASTNLNAVPEVIAGRLTVPVVVPVELILSLLNCDDDAVVPAAGVIVVPANDAVSILFM